MRLLALVELRNKRRKEAKKKGRRGMVAGERHGRMEWNGTE